MKSISEAQQIEAEVEKKGLPKYRELLESVESLPESELRVAAAFMQGVLINSACGK